MSLSGCLVGSALLFGEGAGDSDDETKVGFATWTPSSAETGKADRPDKPTETSPEESDADSQEEGSEAIETEEGSSENTGPAAAESESEASETEETQETAETDETDETEETGTESGGFSMQVGGENDDLRISRPWREQEIPMGEPGTWSIYVYLCGTDLESAPNGMGGLGSSDLQEMCRASGKGNVRFVVETGGTDYWYSEDVSAGRNQRFLIENGSIQKLQDLEKRCMGVSATLTDFLVYCVKNYPAERMGVVLWDHGGGSISGVCFDELYHNDSLSLRELDTALSQVSRRMTDRFELIGFDACLMGTVETANIAANYARYMVGSQELEPGSGWDYESIGTYLSRNPGADGAFLGKAICDGYMKACERDYVDEIATLSVVDLTKLDALLVVFNRFAEDIYSAGADSSTLSEIVRGIRGSESFGGNNVIDGYTNMVDLGSVVRSCRTYSTASGDVQNALSDAVVYRVSGTDHKNAFGLSMYYPLMIQGSEELSIFSDICVSPYYLSFIDRIGYGSVYDGNTGDYEDDNWFSDDGYWEWTHSEGEDEEPGDDWQYDPEAEQSESEAYDEYWNYIDEGDPGSESSLITFEIPPQLDENGNYYFVLDDDGCLYTADVRAYVYQVSEDIEDAIELGETIDVRGDWSTGYFYDYFDGYWISLPDGQNLALYLVDNGEDAVIYSSPVYLNGEETSLRIKQSYTDGSIVVEGAWNGIDDSGASDREIRALQPGDVLIPRYTAWYVEAWEEIVYYGREYIVDENLTLNYGLMDPGFYLYAFYIEDIFGDYYLSDFVFYEVQEDGSVVWFEQE